jgi:hypothetical protein
MRLSLVALSFSALLTACSSAPDQNNVLTPFVQNLFGRAPAAGPTAAQIRSRITPEVRARFGNVPLKIAVLENKPLASILIERQRNRDVVTYFTPDDVSVSYKSGILVGTRGLGFDLMGADVGDVLASLQSRADGAVRIHHYLDGEGQIVMRNFICDYSGAKVIVETCYGDGLQFKNTYQIQGGQVTASRQWISPEQGYIRLESAS